MPNETTGCFDLYDGATNKLIRATDIAWRANNEGGLTAIDNGDTVVISGLKGADGKDIEPVTIWKSMLVKGLVVVPDFYLNGIEATNYEILGETDVLETKTFDVATPLPGETYGSNTTTAIFAAGQPESTPVDGTAYPWGSPYGVNSISTIEYRLNPNNANIDKVDWEAIFENYQVLSTKAAATSLLSAKKNAAGNLEVTYQLAQGSRIAPWAANTSLWGPRDKDNAAWTLMALQAQLTNSDSTCVK